MPGRLAGEIKQQKPFRSLEEEAFLNIVRTADVIRQATANVLASRGLSGPQYNALRILRGAHPDGLACSSIGDRMVSRDPDITRLLDRMEKRGLIKRQRDATDRRVVITNITPAGLELLAALDRPMDDAVVSSLSHIGQESLRELIHLLEEIRQKAD